MAITDSILDSIKPLIGIQEANTAFDTQLILHINSVFMVLNQLGVGGDSVFSIADNTETWADFLPAGDDTEYSLVKSYMALKVKMMFDPSTSGVVLTATKELIAEYESRLNTQFETQPSV